MKRACAFLLGLALCLFIAGSAGAGYIEVTYDLTGSTFTTTQPLGTYVDPLTGTLVIRFGATTPSAPITSAALVSGNTHVSLSQPAPPTVTLTGTTNTVLNPPAGGVAGTLGANTVTFPAIPATVSGFLHCYGGLCGLVGLPPASVPAPITGSQATLPPFVFPVSVASLSGSFMGTLTQTPQTGVVVVIQYVGTETGRIFVPEAGAQLLVGSGIVGLAFFGALRRRRNG